METYKGWNAAGFTRAAKSTSKFGAKIETTLQTEKTLNERIITFFRFMRENNSGIVGPAIATIRAKPLTRSPASGIDTPNSFDT